MHCHLTPHTLALALTGGSDPVEVEKTLRSCPECSQASQTLNRWIFLVDHPDPLVACEVETGWSRLAVVLALPEASRAARIQLDFEMHSWGLCRLLLAEAQGALRIDPTLSEELAELAVLTAGLLDEDYYGKERCLHLRAEAATALEEATSELARLHFAEETLLGRTVRELYGCLLLLRCQLGLRP